MWRFLAAVLMIHLTCLLASAQVPGPAVTVDFERIQDGHVLDGAGHETAELRGEATASDDAHAGATALAVKGVADFGPDFGKDRQATISFWCKPAALSGIMVGKYGGINIEIAEKNKAVRFGLKLSDGWMSCQAPDNTIPLGVWTHITASWGLDGMALMLNDNLVAQAALPATFDWFLEDKPFLLGCYAWPPGYDVWCFEGLIDDFSYRPVQDFLPANIVPAPPAPSAILDARLLDTPEPAYDQPLPATVTGRVVIDANADAIADAGETGLQGVSVTDGYSVTTTDAAGAYTLSPSPDAVFIFITRPPNHDVAGNWYQPVGSEVNFTVTPAALSEDEFTFVVVSDTHISSERRSLEGLSEFVTEVNALDPAPRFVINSGDLVNLDKQMTVSADIGRQYFDSYTGIMNHLNMPYRNVAGDHTDSSYRLDQFPPGDHRAGKAMYWEYLGPNFFSFEYGRLHFVSIDNVYHMAEGTAHELIPEHVAWLRADLRSRSAGAVSLTISENEIERHLPGFAELAAEGGIQLQIVGDAHVVSEKQRPVPSRIHGALSGTWWNGPCADLSPQGYMIYHVTGTSLECFYKGLGERVTMVSPEYGSPLSGQAALQAHLVEPQPGETLEFSVAGGQWRPMTETGRPFHRAIFAATWDTAEVADGLAEVSVRLTPGDEIRTQVFVVNNNRPSPPTDTDATLTFAVGTVIGASLAPAAPVQVLVNGTAVGSIAAGRKGDCSFSVPATVLRKVNALTFDYPAPDQPFTITHPFLTIGDRILTDPLSAAIREVQLNHWDENVVSRAGFAIGDDPYQTSFVMARGSFHFVLPE